MASSSASTQSPLVDYVPAINDGVAFIEDKCLAPFKPDLEIFLISYPLLVRARFNATAKLAKKRSYAKLDKLREQFEKLLKVRGCKRMMESKIERLGEGEAQQLEFFEVQTRIRGVEADVEDLERKCRKVMGPRDE